MLVVGVSKISTENNAGLELVNIAVLIKLALEHFFDRNHGVIETGKFFLESSAIFNKSFEFFDKRLDLRSARSDGLF
jgi:hypothetical protein